MQTATVSIDIDQLRHMPYDQRKARIEELPIDARQKGRLHVMAAEAPIKKSLLVRAWTWMTRTASRAVAFVTRTARDATQLPWLDLLYYVGLAVFGVLLVFIFSSAIIASPLLGVLALCLFGLGLVVAYRAKSVFSWMAAQTLIDLSVQIAAAAIEVR